VLKEKLEKNIKDKEKLENDINNHLRTINDHETNAKHAQLTYENENNKLKENIAN
jgi:hypothetical protein